VVAPAPVGLRWPAKKRFIPSAKDSPLLLVVEVEVEVGAEEAAVPAPPEPLTNPERPVCMYV
jgi:hypothetical protein